MDSRITKLESFISSLENELKEVQKNEAEAKSAVENATGVVDQWKAEVQGSVSIHI